MAFPLDTTTREFRLPSALALARAAQLAYHNAPTVEQVALGQWGFWGLRVLDVDDTQCFVAAGRNAVLVSFRGTEVDDLDDWMADISFELVRGPLSGRVHQGFYEALSHVWRELDELVTQLTRERRRSIWVTGHSLGGALATLAVARWLEADAPLAGLYTFGQPRCGNEEFSRNFDFAFRPYAFRFVNNADLITRTPPRVAGYRHTGSFRYFTDDGRYVEDISWWRSFLDSWHGGVQGFFRTGDVGLGDHSLSRYVSCLENVCGPPLSMLPGGPLAAPRRRAA